METTSGASFGPNGYYSKASNYYENSDQQKINNFKNYQNNNAKDKPRNKQLFINK